MNRPMASATAASSKIQLMPSPAPARTRLRTGNGNRPARRRHPGAACLLLSLVLAGCVPVRPAVRPTPSATALPAPACQCPPAVTTPQIAPEPPVTKARLEPAGFDELPGWRDDDVAAGFTAFVSGCPVLRTQARWTAVCSAAEAVRRDDARAQRVFLESSFVPHRVVAADGKAEGLLTGYYEPLLRGSRQPDARYRHPLYGPPDDLITVDLSAVAPDTRNVRLRGRLVGRKLLPYWSRAEIEEGRAPLKGRELLWVDDAVELFFLQVQGSGRVRMEGGETVRVGYADQNGHPYRSIGRVLVDRGDLPLEKASMQGIRAWGQANAARLPALLNENPSYVFFRVLPDVEGGPPGALGVPLLAGRSIAVDPVSIPLGAPVFLASTQPGTDRPLQRLVAAQDTGGAIRGAVRADFFWGFGPEAGELAGRMRQPLRLWVLLPRP